MHPFSNLRAGFLLGLATLGLSAAEIPEVIPLWPGKPPGCFSKGWLKKKETTAPAPAMTSSPPACP